MLWGRQLILWMKASGPSRIQHPPSLHSLLLSAESGQGQEGPSSAVPLLPGWPRLCRGCRLPRQGRGNRALQDPPQPYPAVSAWVGWGVGGWRRVEEGVCGCSSSALGLASGPSLAQPLLDSLGTWKEEKEGNGKGMDCTVPCQGLYIHEHM